MTADTAQSFDKNRHSLSDPASPWVLVNKLRPVPQTYAPDDLEDVILGNGRLRKEANQALTQLFAAALDTEQISLKAISSYRSYATQVTTYNAYVAQDGSAVADTYSARPGHSEHQTGWVADVGSTSCDLELCFGDTAAGRWLASHAHEYGFIIRYLRGKEAITGYQYEPWHIRYVGRALAAELYKSGKTMEEFFDVVPAAQPY